jgi:transglutaminase-like putative cysteine protease
MLLSILMATMASLATLMLGMGQRDMLLPAITFLSASLSVIFTDGLGWFRLNRWIANVAMLLAAFFSLGNFFQTSSHGQLLAIANLLIYVQIILLFQQKNRRIYGQLAVFGLLQVVVAALLNNGLEFGLLLVIYMIVTMFGLALFFIYREVERVQVIERRQAERRKRLLAGQEGSPSMLGGPPEVVLEPITDARNMDFRPWKIVRPVLSMITVTAIFSVVFFYNAPRSGSASWDSGGSRNMVGFSPEVTFDQMGQVLLSNERVMRVNFTNAVTEANYTVIGEPYFRGGVLTKYLTSGGNGQWRQEIDLDNANLPLRSAPNVRELVRQDVLMEPTGSRHLFSVFPVYAMAATHPEIRVTPRTRKLVRDSARVRHLRDEYRFSVVTSAFRYGTQSEVLAHSNRVNTEANKRLMDRMNRRLRFIDNRRAFPKLIELAEQIVQGTAPGANNYEKAKALEQHFLDEEAYKYSLNFDEINARRQPEVDPVEDFVSNHRTGHCEYFASALTLMLRSQGIPARMIVGYRGGEFNYVGHYFLIRQKHAHAWVEAYLTPDEVPAGSLDQAEMHAGGGWLRLDPTPGRSNAMQIVRPGMFDRVSKSFDYAQWLWSDYVLGLSPERQRNALMGSWGFDKMLGFEDLAAEGDWPKWIKQLRGLGNAESLNKGFSWRAGVAALFVSLAFYGVYRFLRRILPVFRTFTRMRRARRRRLAGTRIEFYKRFESLLSKLGMRRQPGETQREFADSAAGRLAESSNGAAGISDIPQQIVSAFYDVRFGNTPLSEQLTEEMEGKLERLKKAVNG